MDVRPESPRERLTARQVVEADRLLVIAHRGASHIAPENTLPAFQAALDLNANSDAQPGVDLIELDYRESADGVPVVLHDDLLDRTTDACQRWQAARIPLAVTSLDQLRALDAGSWLAERFAGTRIPMLAEALEVITAQSIALVERKAGSAEGFTELLRKADKTDRVVLQAFDWQYLADCQRLAPDLTLAALGEHELTEGCLDEIDRLRVPVVAWDHEQITRQLLSRIQGRGLKFWAWTVDDPERMRELADWGIDGIITNRPDELREIRDYAAL